VQHRLCPLEAAHAGVGKWPGNFRKKTQGRAEGELLAIRQRAPEPAVLFVSGYQDADRFRDFLLETGAAALGKPSGINALLKYREGERGWEPKVKS
jgi:hypothetical protein